MHSDASVRPLVLGLWGPVALFGRASQVGVIEGLSVKNQDLLVRFGLFC